MTTSSTDHNNGNFTLTFEEANLHKHPLTHELLLVPSGYFFYLNNNSSNQHLVCEKRKYGDDKIKR